MPIYDAETANVITEQENKSIMPHIQSERVNTSMLTVLPGSKWHITYFKRVVDDNSLEIQYDPAQDISTMDFLRINNMVIYVDSALPTTESTDVTGSGIIDASFTPNPNDIIISKTPIGRIIMLTVTSVATVNYNSTDIYKIGYKIFKIVNDITDEVYTKLLKATSSIVRYNEEHRINHQPAITDEEEAVKRKKLVEHIERNLSLWDKTFIKADTGYNISYIENNKIIYDNYLANFLFTFIGKTVISNNVILVPYEDKTYSIFDYLLGNVSIEVVNKYLTLIAPENLGKYKSIILKYLDIDYFIVLNNDNIELSNEDTDNILFPPLGKDTYILRDVMYEILKGKTPDTTLTKFELVLLDVINKNVMDINGVLELNEALSTLSKKEMFYYIPLMNYITKHYLVTFSVKFI